jgi:hypothetical protein
VNLGSSRWTAPRVKAGYPNVNPALGGTRADRLPIAAGRPGKAPSARARRPVLPLQAPGGVVVGRSRLRRRDGNSGPIDALAPNNASMAPVPRRSETGPGDAVFGDHRVKRPYTRVPSERLGFQIPI